MSYRIILFLLSVSVCTLAQPCTDSDRLKQTGYWTPGSGESTSGLSAIDAVKQKQVVHSIIESIKKKYTPRGLDIGYQGVYFNNSELPENVKPGYRYFARFYFYKHPCGPYKKADNPGFNSFLQININDFDFRFSQTLFVESTPNEENTWADGFELIEQKPTFKDGAWYWKSGTGNYTDVDYYWVIARDEQVPFLHISKKEFAERLKIYFEKKIKEVESEYTKTIQSGEETYLSLKKIDEKAAAQSREQTKVQAEEIRKIGRETFGNSLRVVESTLNTTDATILSQPARVSDLDGLDEFKGFANDSDANSKWVIKPNPSYFNPKLQKSTPQFITVHFKIREGETELVYKAAKDEMLEAIDFNLLKTMLGK